MARDFTKNTSNHLSFGNGTINPLLSGATAISCHAIAKADTFSTGAASQNDILGVIIDGSNHGLVLNVDATGANPVLRVSGRSVTGDAIQATVGTSTLAAGTVYSLGGVLNIGGDSIRVYVNGTQEASTGVTFGNATYTTGTPTSPDRIGCAGNPLATPEQWDGMIAEVALWNVDIATAGFAQLADKFSALMVRPDALVFYMALWAQGSPERDLVAAAAATVTGSLPKLDHPLMTYPWRRTAPRAQHSRFTIPAGQRVFRPESWHPIHAG